MKNPKSLFMIFILFSLVSLTLCAQRYKDDIMMQKHHHQKNLQTQGTINVHLIPHSHDDVGWLKTVDNYFYGGDQKTQWAGVQYTIDTVVSEMSANKDYKFSIVEVAFLYRWWNNANQTQRQQMKALVQNGQLQFINGGWCMSDEAAPYYEDVIDQMTIGLRWLKQTFNYVPKVAWHIDPFGHQASSASLFSRMGFQSFFFARIDYQDKQLRLNNKALEMVWHPLQYTQDKTNYIFTHVNYYHYSPPPGFCYDLKCDNEPVKDDPTMEQYNIIDKSNQLVAYFKSMALHFRSNTLMHTLGEDFTFANARMWFKNFDKLIKYINERPEYGVKLMYSTPGVYIQTIQKQQNSYPTKLDDFFPYADRQHGYWTGYFTSRTGLKGFVRSFGRWLQAVRKQISQAKISGTSQYIKDNTKVLQEKIWGLQMAMGILQHHDGVSGTSKQKVAFDYVNTALRAISEFSKVYRQIKSEQINLEIGEKISSSDIYFNVFWNQTAKITGLQDKINANKTVLVGLYNPGAKGTYQIRIDVPERDLNIIGSNGNINGDVLCVDLYNQANCQLVFSINIQESSNAYVKLVPVKTGSAKVVKLKELTILDSSKQFKLTPTSSIKITKSSQKFDLNLNGTLESFLVGYNFYQSYQGAGQKSGAYIFRPAFNTPKQFSAIKKIHYAEGTGSVCIVLEGDRTSTKLYFSKVPNYIESYGVQIQTFIDSIPIIDNIGKQVTLNIKTNYQNNKTFYTDSNGLEQQKRIINYRPTWNLVVNQPVAGNYYPINSHIRLVDVATNKNLTLLTQRSVGGAIINQGQFEIMIHRRLTHDDSRGVDQPLNEQQRPGVGLTQQVRHYLVFGNNFRTVQKRNDQKIAISLSPTSTSTFAKQAIRNGPLKVPSNVKLYLRPFTDQSYLMRIHNMDTDNSASVNLIDGWQATQYTLSANQLLADWQKNQYKWNQDSSASDINQQQKSTIFDSILSQGQKIKEYFSPNSSGKIIVDEQINYKSSSDSTLVLRPFEIRTFKLTKVNA